MGEHASENGKTFALSLGDPKLCRLFKDTQLAVLRYVDFLFANKEVMSDFSGPNGSEVELMEDLLIKSSNLKPIN